MYRYVCITKKAMQKKKKKREREKRRRSHMDSLQLSVWSYCLPA